jgi:hypothetical protein
LTGRVTDDARTPTGDDLSAAASGPERPAPAPEQPADRTTRRRWWIGGAIAAAAVFILLVCGSMGALAAGFGRLAREADDTREGHARVDAACLELETRLNRLAPPGSTANPGQRAAAIRDENAAVRPFLSEIEQLRIGRPDDDRDDDERRGRRGWDEDWRQLVDARSAYADALDRQVTRGEPAFFLAPQDRRGRPVLEELRHAPESCAAAIRRLAAPDL